MGIIKAGNANNHPITAEDPHTNGSPLVPSTYMADFGYFADGTSMIKAGNANNHPITALDPTPTVPLCHLRIIGGGWLYWGWHRRDEGRQHEQPMSNGTRVDLQSWCRFQS